MGMTMIHFTIFLVEKDIFEASTSKIMYSDCDVNFSFTGKATYENIVIPRYWTLEGKYERYIWDFFWIRATFFQTKNFF